MAITRRPILFLVTFAFGMIFSVEGAIFNVLRHSEGAEMSDTTDAFHDIWAYCTSNNRLVPLPTQWSQLYGLLMNTRQKPSGGWEPALPLILAAWHHTMPIEKQLRFKEHVEWAQQNGQLAQISGFLRALPKQQWCHFGEI